MLPPRSLLFVTFADEDFYINDPDHDDPMVITATISNCPVRKGIRLRQLNKCPLLVDFLEARHSHVPHQVLPRSIVGICKGTSTHEGYIDLLTTFVNQLSVVISTPHMAMKFPTENNSIIIMKVNHKVVQECYSQSLKEHLTQSKVLPLTAPYRLIPWNYLRSVTLLNSVMILKRWI